MKARIPKLIGIIVVFAALGYAGWGLWKKKEPPTPNLQAFLDNVASSSKIVLPAFRPGPGTAKEALPAWVRDRLPEGFAFSSAMQLSADGGVSGFHVALSSPLPQGKWFHQVATETHGKLRKAILGAKGNVEQSVVAPHGVSVLEWGESGHWYRLKLTQPSPSSIAADLWAW